MELVKNGTHRNRGLAGCWGREGGQAGMGEGEKIQTSSVKLNSLGDVMCNVVTIVNDIVLHI